MLRADTRSFDRLGNVLGALPIRLNTALADALNDWSLEVIEESGAAYVPVDTGALQDSRFREGPIVSANSVSVTMGYDTTYATKQHEDLSLNHPHGGQAKYLEQPIAERGPDFPRFVQERLR